MMLIERNSAISSAGSAPPRFDHLVNICASKGANSFSTELRNCEAMPQGVTRHPLLDPRRLSRVLDRLNIFFLYPLIQPRSPGPQGRDIR
jgi:hypothetical protein